MHWNSSWKGELLSLLRIACQPSSKFPRIIVLDQGRVIAVGDHAQLLANCDWYRRNYEMQSLQIRTEKPAAHLLQRGADHGANG
jgi:hypothetical protein